jgi:hypothetical protein
MEYGVDAGILGICSMELAKDYEDAVKAIAKTKNGKGVEYDGGSLWDFTGDVSTNFDEENEKYHICAGYSQEIYIKRGYDDEDEDDEDD